MELLGPNNKIVMELTVGEMDLGIFIVVTIILGII
jgi:hypothetical protein